MNYFMQILYSKIFIFIIGYEISLKNFYKNKKYRFKIQCCNFLFLSIETGFK